MFKGRAELTDERGTVVADDIPINVLHKVAREREPSLAERRLLREHGKSS